MNILILGGTVFLGRHVVDSAVKRGHKVTIFHRGTHPAHRDDIKEILGDRTGSLEELSGSWDAVVDTSGYLPAVVKKSVEKFSGSAYCFVSSISVYDDFSVEKVDENSPVACLDDTASKDIQKDYGPLKAACEQVVRFQRDINLIVRPGLIVGPYDPSDRFTYWPVKFAENSQVLCPAYPDVPVQFIDARDLADWIVIALEAGVCGTYNTAGPEKELLFSSFVRTCSELLRGKPVFTGEEFLVEQGVSSWTDLPLWIAKKDNMTGHSRVDSSEAFAHGLVCRPLEETVKDTLEWYLKEGGNRELKWGMSRKREEEVLELWEKRC